MPRLPWIDRTWEFNFPTDLYPGIVERLRGTPVRIDKLVRGLSAEELTRRHRDTWSIQENVGHLFDLEALLRARLEDFVAGVEVLTAADMTNRVTHEAGHHSRTIDIITGAFSAMVVTVMNARRMLAKKPPRSSVVVMKRMSGCQTLLKPI